MPRGVIGLFMAFLQMFVAVLPSLRGLYEGRPECARADFQLLTEEPIEKPVGARAVAVDLQCGQVAADRAEIEALVLLVAAAQRGGGEVPGQPEEPAALLGVRTDAPPGLFQQRPHRLDRRSRPRRRGQA